MSGGGRVRSIDRDGDWTFGKGKANYLTGNQMVAQNLHTRIMSVLGDCFFDLAAGIDWFNLMGSHDLTGFVLAVKTTILNTQYVTGIVELGVNLTQDRNRTLTYEVSTVFGGSVRGSLGFLTDESGRIITTEDGEPIDA